jgi:hypothetical protein
MDDSRILARRIIAAPTRVMIAIFAAISIWILLTPSDMNDFLGRVFLVSIGFGSLGFIIYCDFSHQLMWDDERILMPHGGFWRIFGGEWPETSIRIADIEHVHVDYWKMSARQRRYIPFDHITLEGPTEGPEPHVMIMPNFINTDDCREALRHIERLRPGVLSEEVITFMNSEKRW